MTDPRPLLSEIARLKAELEDTREAVTIAYMVSAEKAKDEIARLRNILKETENAVIIAYEDGAMQRLGRGLSEAQKEIARLNAELADAKRQADDAQGAVQVYCDDYNRAKAETTRLRSELDRLTQERDAAISAVSIAEEATRKALESIPTAMDAAVEKEREASAKRISELESLLAKATRFDVGCVCVESRGEGFWAVTDCGGVYTADGEWEFEPIPSSRSEAFIARTRFPLDEAIALAEKVSAPISAVEKEGRDG